MWLIPVEESITSLIEDAYSFCCSFFDEKASIDIKYDDDEEMPEASAFDDDAEYERIELQMKRSMSLIEVPMIVRQMKHMQIDFDAVRVYFK